MKHIFNYVLLLFLIHCTQSADAQYLSNLHAGYKNPLYTTYAAPLQRSEYIVNQAYHLRWYDRTQSIVFESKQGGCISFVFKKGNQLKSRLEQFYQQPVITASYPDMVKFYFYPFRSIRVSATCVVYSSRQTLFELEVLNEGLISEQVQLFPYFCFDDKLFSGVEKNTTNTLFYFTHEETPDGWMKSHQIPFQAGIRNLLLFNDIPDSYSVYKKFKHGTDTSRALFMNDLINNRLSESKLDKGQIIAFQYNMHLLPGQCKALRWVRGVSEIEQAPEAAQSAAIELLATDTDNYINDNEKLFAKIPTIHFDNPAHEAIYWNSFSLMRQCMLPSEGACGYNYYVFSREPRWGWGYGGQVFHESLVMLAYVYMDPMGAMNSQRIFMERQQSDGYINYRTGPYLNETIITKGQPTTSAPWFNWINLELYQITHDQQFLQEAYQAGKKFYKYILDNRDTDRDGLCEWGGHGTLESVRDARVAIWDQVGDPSHFEALDLNIMLVKEAKSLSQMAALLGFYDESTNFAMEAKNRKLLLNKYMWDEKTGFYYHINKNDHTFTYREKNDLKRQEIIAFLSLWAGIAEPHQATKLMDHLSNPDKFQRRYGVPTLAADDPYYNPIGYWNGPIWIQWQYLIFRGLMDYGYFKEAKDLTCRVSDNIAAQLSENHWFWEFYSADDLQAGWNKTYIWSGIIARFYIDLAQSENQ